MNLCLVTHVHHHAALCPPHTHSHTHNPHPCPPPNARQVHEATAELTANMNQEHCVCMTFLRDAFGYTLTPVQASSRPRRLFCTYSRRVVDADAGRGGAAVCGSAEPPPSWTHSPSPPPLLPGCAPQKAAAIVKSFPYFPDMYSISSVRVAPAGRGTSLVSSSFLVKQLVAQRLVPGPKGRGTSLRATSCKAGLD